MKVFVLLSAVCVTVIGIPQETFPTITNGKVSASDIGECNGSCIFINDCPYLLGKLNEFKEGRNDDAIQELRSSVCARANHGTLKVCCPPKEQDSLGQILTTIPDEQQPTSITGEILGQICQTITDGQHPDHATADPKWCKDFSASDCGPYVWLGIYCRKLCSRGDPLQKCSNCTKDSDCTKSSNNCKGIFCPYEHGILDLVCTNMPPLIPLTPAQYHNTSAVTKDSLGQILTTIADEQQPTSITGEILVQICGTIDAGQLPPANVGYDWCSEFKSSDCAKYNWLGAYCQTLCHRGEAADICTNCKHDADCIKASNNCSGIYCPVEHGLVTPFCTNVPPVRD